jgi:hypothetical protein
MLLKSVHWALSKGVRGGHSPEALTMGYSALENCRKFLSAFQAQENFTPPFRFGRGDPPKISEKQGESTLVSPFTEVFSDVLV